MERPVEHPRTTQVPHVLVQELQVVAAIFAGGFAGGIARSALEELAPADPGTWPWTTLVINIVGALVLGALVTWLADHRRPHSPYSRPLLGTGFCGALTTFSTMQLELLHMLDDRAWVLAVTYAAVSVAAGLLAVLLGTRLVRRAGRA